MTLDKTVAIHMTIVLISSIALVTSLELYGATDQEPSNRLFVEGQCTYMDRQQLHGCVRANTRPETILITGGAGFLGSHLVDNLMLEGHKVVVVDDLSTGDLSNIAHWLTHEDFRFINQDIEKPLDIFASEIYHLASPASPRHYMSDPIKTIRTNTLGTDNVLSLAQKMKARVVLASTSEVYGDPEVHPQHENYWGNVNPIGPRSCYDEGKRLSESLATAYAQKRNVSIGIARIFNTYGPRMHQNDGRVVSNFITQALKNEPLTVYGSGKQTRSFQHVSDLVAGLRQLMKSNSTMPVNLGNPEEIAIRDLASKIKTLITHSNSSISHSRLPVDDPHRRRPDIRRARELLDWSPLVSLDVGLKKTVDYFSYKLSL